MVKVLKLYIYIYMYYTHVITSRKISIKINSKAIVEMKCDTEQMMKLE